MNSAQPLHPRSLRFAERACGRDPIQRVLAVTDLRAVEQPAVEKAARLAAAYGASLELYACDDCESVPASWAGGSTLAQYRSVVRERRIAVLQEIAAPLRARGLDVSVTYEGLVPTAEALVIHAIRTGVNLVVKATGRSRAGRSTANEADSVLLSQLPMPLLLVRAESWDAQPRVAAGVDPCHRAERPVELDESVVGLCGSIAHALGGVSFAMHVLEAPAHLPGNAVPEDERQRAFEQQRAEVLDLAQRAQLDDREVRFIEQRMPDGIVQMANEARPAILVIGVAARQRPGAGVGGTAAEVLAQTQCDLLVVKPAGFVSPAMVME
jgi:universal stress protein E